MKKFNFSNETLLTSCFLFFKHQSIEKVNKEILRPLIFITYFYIASKFTEVKPPKLIYIIKELYSFEIIF